MGYLALCLFFFEVWSPQRPASPPAQQGLKVDVFIPTTRISRSCAKPFSARSTSGIQTNDALDVHKSLADDHTDDPSVRLWYADKCSKYGRYELADHHYRIILQHIRDYKQEQEQP